MPTITQKIKQNKTLLIILTIALTLRVATALWLGDTMEVLPAGGTHDQVSYDMLAHRVSTGHGFTFPQRWYPWVQPDTPTSYYSGTMVLHLALIYKIFGYHPLIARLLYALLGTLICYYTYRIGRQLFNKKVGLIAASLATGYAYLILYSATLLTETPFILFLLIAIDTAYRLTKEATTKRFIYFGLALVGTVLFRMAVLPFVIALLIWMYLVSRQSIKPVKVWQLLIPIGLIILFILPWTLRNYRLYDRFMLLESQFGHVFWNSNHPNQGNTFDEVGWVAIIPPDLLTLNEVDLTNELLRRGIENVASDPGRYIQLSLSRTQIFFQFWPTANSSTISNLSRVLSFGITLPFMLYGLILTRHKWRELLPLYLFLIFHCGIYLASWVMIRYRVPADTILLPFAALALATLQKKRLEIRD